MQSQAPSGRDHTNMASPTSISSEYPTVPLPGVSKKVTCPVCATTFAPGASDGKCPVCGEQVVRPGQAGGDIPLISPALAWARQKGSWKVIALGALILYQVIMFIVLWIHLAQIHAL